MAHPALDAIQGIGGSSQALGSTYGLDQGHDWMGVVQQQHSVQAYSFYMIVIQMVNHLSLDKIDGQIEAEADMMQVEHDMQESLTTISKYISTVQNQSGDTTDLANEATAAFKKLFYCNTDQTAPTVESVSSVANPNIFQQGQDFNLGSLWSKLNSEYSEYNRSVGGQSLQVIGTNPTDHVSLIQRYIAAKAKLSVYTEGTTKVDAAAGDITQLLGDLGPKGNESFITQLMQMFTNTSDFMLSDHSVKPASADISSMTTSINDGITTLGSVTSTESNNMQAATSNEGSIVDIAHKGLQSLSDGIKTIASNEVSG
jgi:hypothetical protein